MYIFKHRYQGDITTLNLKTKDLNINNRSHHGLMVQYV